MGIIVDVYGREVLDSRGNPTVEVEVTLDDGSMVALRFPQALPRRIRSGRVARWRFRTLPRQRYAQGGFSCERRDR